LVRILDAADSLGPYPLISFRANPEFGGGHHEYCITAGPDVKFGILDKDLTGVYQSAKDAGFSKFGIHMHVGSGILDTKTFDIAATKFMNIIEEIASKLDLTFEFIDFGGGIGIPYRPEDKPFDIAALVAETETLLDDFRKKQGYVPAVYVESGRFMTGPHGILVATIVNRMSKYREYIGVDASTWAANVRPAVYETAYHHVTILDQDGNPKSGSEEVVDVVGPLCENSDKFARQRLLPKTEIGDIMVQHDTGAHTPAMASNYNGWLRPKILMLRTDGSVELIKRAETMDDLFATLDFKPEVLK